MRYLHMERRERVNWVGWWILLTLLLSAKVAAADPYKSDAGAYEVTIALADWRDDNRDRTVPVKIYLPANTEGARPVVIVSHGLGGNRETLSYLGNHWASHGYVCVHMQHLGSDTGILRNGSSRRPLAAMREAATNPEHAVNRAKDTSFVLDELERQSKKAGSLLNKKLDLSKVGIAGHSYGAWTAMAAGGITGGGQRGVKIKDSRVLCMIPLSPPVVSDKRLYEVTYGSLDIPALFMTGTLDKSVVASTTAEERQIPYRTMPGVSQEGKPKYQINFYGADHMTFAGETRTRRLALKKPPKNNPVFHGLILQSTTAFLDCYLLGNEMAEAWLNGGGFVKAVGSYGKVDMDVTR